DNLAAWIAKQYVFFVATAPNEGYLNLSPKGLDSFRILAPNRVGYLDLTGSGAETVAHVKENGRIVLMFCAFEGPARILLLHGTAYFHELAPPGYAELKPSFPDIIGERAIIEIAVLRISDSCGFGVPIYEYQGERGQLERWAERKGENGL